jgi:hypothetical protein
VGTKVVSNYAVPVTQHKGGDIAAVKILLTVCWCITIVAGLTACERQESDPLSGEISLQYTDSSKSNVSFSLRNGTSRAIHIRGGRTLSLAIEAWDAGFECERIPHTVPEEEPIGLSEGRPTIFKVSPGERARLVVATTLPQRYKGGLCRLKLMLQDGTVVGPFEFRPR